VVRRMADSGGTDGGEFEPMMTVVVAGRGRRGRRREGLVGRGREGGEGVWMMGGREGGILVLMMMAGLVRVGGGGGGRHGGEARGLARGAAGRVESGMGHGMAETWEGPADGGGPERRGMEVGMAGIGGERAGGMNLEARTYGGVEVVIIPIHRRGWLGYGADG